MALKGNLWVDFPDFVIPAHAGIKSHIYFPEEDHTMARLAVKIRLGKAEEAELERCCR